jgi:hypothetical protein
LRLYCSWRGIMDQFNETFTNFISQAMAILCYDFFALRFANKQQG